MTANIGVGWLCKLSAEGDTIQLYRKLGAHYTELPDRYLKEAAACQTQEAVCLFLEKMQRDHLACRFFHTNNKKYIDHQGMDGTLYHACPLVSQCQFVRERIARPENPLIQKPWCHQCALL